MASQDELPIKIVVIPPSSAQVSRAMADIEAKVLASGRKMGQAGAPNDKIIMDSTKRVRKQILALDKRNASERLKIQKALGASIFRSIQKQNQAILENNRHKTRAMIAQEKSVAKARFAASQEGIFRAAGIKSPQARLKEISSLKRAQRELTRELKRGTITRLQYNTILKDTHKRMNLLERGDVRARGALHRLIARTASLTFELTGAVYGLITMGAALSSPAILGVRFLKTLEDTKLGISGILLAMGSINGEMLTFEQAAAAADEQIDLLAQDAIRLAGTLEDFTKSFQAVLAPGLAAGMTISEIRKIAVAGTVAVKTIGLDSRQIVQEIRDLVAGGIQAASSTLATSLGLTDKDIKKAKLSTEGLFVFLSSKLEGFYTAGLQRSETLSGKMEQTWEVFIRAMAKSSEPVFETLKGLFDDILSRIADIDELAGTVTFNQEFIDSIKNYVSAINDVLQIIIKVVKTMWDFKDAILTIIKIKIGITLWGAATKGAKVYLAILGSIITAEKGAMAFGELRAIMEAKRAAKSKGGALFGGMLSNLVLLKTSIKRFFSGGIKSIFKAATRLIFSIVGKLGLIGLAIWGIYEAGSAIWDRFKEPLEEVKNEVKKTNKEILNDLISLNKKTTSLLSKQIKGLEVNIEYILNTGGSEEQVKAMRGFLTKLRATYDETIESTKKFENQNMSLSDRIQRHNASLIAARKSIAALGGEYTKAGKEADDLIQAILSLERVRISKAVLVKRGAKAGEQEAFDRQLLVFNKEEKHLEKALKLKRELRLLESKVKVAAPGSIERIAAQDALDRQKLLIPLLGEEEKLKESLNHLREQEDSTEITRNLINLTEQMLGFNKSQQKAIENLDNLTPAQERWNVSLREATNISRDYISSLEAKTASEELALETERGTGLESKILITKNNLELERVKIIDKYTKLLEKAKKMELGGGEERMDLLRQENDELAKINEATKKRIEDTEIFHEKSISWEQGQTAAFTGYITAAENAAEQAKGFFSSVFSALESDMEKAFKGGAANFEEFTKSILDGLLRIQIQKIIVGIGTGLGLGGNYSGAEGVNLGSEQDIMLWEQTSGFAKGGVFDPTGLVAFAQGGVVNGPTVFPFAKGTGLMGEAGPEAIMPLSRTTSGDLGIKVSGNQGNVINQVSVEVNINTDGTSDTQISGDDVDAKALGDSVGQLVQGELVKQMRPGGLLNRSR